jgi:adenylate cyclase
MGLQQVKNIEDPIRAYAARELAVRSAAVSEDSLKPLPLPDKPSIAVLPFQNMSLDPEQEYFADGVVEDIITALSRFKSLFVIARNSSFTYKGRAVDIKQVGRELGVRYVLEGSVRRSSNRVRITAQLIDAETNNHLWAERYDRDMADIFAVQDEITETVAIAIEPTVAQMEQWRAVRKPPESLSSWEAYQRGLWHSGRIGTTENEAAKTFFRRAIDLDPSFAPPHAWLANTILSEAWLYQTKSMPEALDEALPVAQKAISLDPLDAVAHCGVGYVRFFRGDHDDAVAEARQALIINPNYAGAHQLLGSTLVFSGHPREGIEALRMAMRLDPNDLQRQIRFVHISMGHYFLREYDAAVEAAKEAVRSHPDLGPRSLAAALGQAGRFDEAKQALQKAIAVAPRSFNMYVRQRAPWFRPEDYSHVLEGLRKAGWEG